MKTRPVDEYVHVSSVAWQPFPGDSWGVDGNREYRCRRRVPTASAATVADPVQ